MINGLLSFRLILSILYDTDRIENTALNSFPLLHMYSLLRGSVYGVVA
jgi:hypothetical protein